jgi:hypothetical protein
MMSWGDSDEENLVAGEPRAASVGIKLCVAEDKSEAFTPPLRASSLLAGRPAPHTTYHAPVRLKVLN